MKGFHMSGNISGYLKTLLLTAACLLLTAIPLSAKIMEVEVTVLNEKNKEPLFDVDIFDANIRIPGTDQYKDLGITNPQGIAVVTVDDNGELLIVVPDAGSRKEKVKGRRKIVVLMAPPKNRNNNYQLDEITKTRKAGGGFTPKDTKIKENGHWVKFDIQLIVPRAIMKDNRRAIIQNVVRDNTIDTIYYGRPVVIDCEEYAITQARMFDGDMTRDPLYKYSRAPKYNEGDSMLIFEQDSVYIDPLPNGEHDLQVIQYSWVLDYSKIVNIQSRVVGHGSQNPMRFFKFDSYGAILADNSRNRNYIPTIQKQSLPTPREMNMNFVVGRPNIDYSDSATVAAMDDLIAELKSTEDDGSDVRLTGFGLKVTSSPEGSFETNKKLAGQRAVFAANAVLNNLSRATRNGIQNDFGRTAEVAPWSAMVELLRKDSLVEEANAVQAILDEIPGTEGYDMDRQGVRIKKLPFYYPVIADRLVKLRKVEYLIVTETWREFTDEELLDWFKVGKLSRLHETRDIWRLSHLVDSLDQKEQILRYGMDVAKRKYGTASPAAFATHAVFANDLAAIMIDQKKSDVAILKEYVDTLPKAGLGLVPEEIWANQAVAYMAKKGRSNYLKAADYLNRIGANRFDESEYLHRVGLYLRALLGDYEDGLAEIAAERPMNEVALLLEWEQDALAWEKAQKLDDSADAFYLRAIAARRMADSTDDFAMQDMASENLARAIMLNPAYEKLAAIDGDVLKILPYAQNFIAEIKEKERFEALAAAEEADLESAQIEMEAEDIALQAKSDAMDMGATEEEATAIGQKAAQEYREQKAKEREERLAAEKNRRRSTKTAEEIAEEEEAERIAAEEAAAEERAAAAKAAAGNAATKK